MRLRKLKKGLAILLSLAMVVGLLPGVGTMKVSAAENGNVELEVAGHNGEFFEYYGPKSEFLLDNYSCPIWIASISNSPYIVIKASEPILVTKYKLRAYYEEGYFDELSSPTAWTLSACNDFDETTMKGEWTVISTVENAEFDSNYVNPSNECTVSDSLTEKYQYFKLTITGNGGGTSVCLSQFSMTYELCDHNWENTGSQIPPTCTECGYDVKKCSKCGHEIQVQNDVPATGHKWVTGKTFDPTCTEDGYTLQTCSVCSETGKTDIQNALGHDFNEDGKCACGTSDTSPYKPKGEGTAESPYLISTVGELLWFAGLVNGTMDGITRNTSASAVLTKDIDFGDNNFAAIGTETYPFSGTFDGAGYSITVNQRESTDVALFGFLGNSTVKNLTVTGTINTTTTKFAAGIAMQTKSSTTATIENCISDVTIESSISGDGTHAGLVGVPQGSLNINNCAFIGAINGASTNSCGGMIGYAKGTVKINNSYIAATFNLDDTSCHTFSRNFAQYVTLTNCYYLNALGDVPASATQLTGEQFSNGEASYRLQGGQTEVVWGQKIGTDRYPVLGGSVVYYSDGKYYNSDSACDVHEWTIIETIAPTCTKTGYDKKKCSKCGTMTIVQNENSATGHTWIDGDIEIAATCTEEGRIKQTCACGASQSVTIPATHKYNSDGYCTVCNKRDITPKKPNVIGEVYQIGTVNELYWFAGLVNGNPNVCTGDVTQNISANAVLTADIVVNKCVLDEEGGLVNDTSILESWTPIGHNAGKGYRGTFNGNNHSISGLYFNDTHIYLVGLFGLIWSKGSISNVGIKDSYFNGIRYVGGICGENKNGTITNCYNAGTVSASEGRAGGICGGGEGIITNCYNRGRLNGSGPLVSGICGDNNVIIKNCYYDNTKCSFKGIEGDDITGQAEGKTTSQFNSGEVAYLLSLGTDGATWGQKLTDDKQEYPVLGGIPVYRNCTDGTLAYSNEQKEKKHSYQEGVCSVCGAYEMPEFKDKAYQIANRGNLYWFAGLVNGDVRICTGGVTQKQSANAVLTENIVLNQNVLQKDGTLTIYAKSLIIWTPIGDKKDNGYQGIFNGNNHSISGLYCNYTSTEYVGLFGCIGDLGKVSNIGIEDSYIEGYNYVGGICGENNGIITNCYFMGEIDGASAGGGICEKNCGSIINCYQIGKKYNHRFGICGRESTNNKGIIKNCYYHAMWEMDSFYGTTYKTDAQFASGEVAYLLNEGKSGDDVVWRQNLGEANGDAAPMLDSSHDIVYVGEPCPVYTNESHKEHSYVINADGKSHTCSDCGTTEQHADVAKFTVDDLNHSITATCPGGCELGMIALSATNTTYDGTEKAASISGEIKGFSPDIVYEKKAEDGSFATIDSTPKDAGTYRASITYTVDADNSKVYTVSTEYTIARRPVTITANDASKTYEETDPALSFTVSEETPLVDGEALSGELSRLTGENAGTYTITQGTVTNDNNPNYDITFNEGTFTINKAQTWETADCVMNLVYDENSGSYIATIEKVDNAEYRFDGFEWSNVNICNGITPHTSVTGYIRIAGDKNHEPGIETYVNETAGHGLKHVAAKAADCEHDGNIEYWHCVTCDNNYRDSEGINEVYDYDLVISKFNHKWSSNYECDETSHWYNCENANCPVTDNSKKEGYAEHCDGNNNGICDVCDYRIEYIIAVSILDDNGRTIEANVEGLHNYIPGAPVKLIVPVIAGYNFVGWYNKGSQTGDPICKSRTYEFKAEADRDLVAVYKPIGSAELTIDGGKSFTINGDNGTSGDTVTYPLGSQITVVCNDSGFEYWKNSAGMVVSRDKSYTFTVTGKETISAVFNVIEENQVTVVFESYYGQVIARDQYATDATLTETPGLPFRYGYTALGWDYNGDGIYDASESTEDTFSKALERGFASEDKLVKILPVYQLIENTYRITVENGTGAGNYNQNEVVTVEANVPSDGMKFSHWEDGAGNILSYNEKYQFYAAKNITVTAVYVEDTAEVEAKGTTVIIDKYADKTNGKLTFVSMSTVPEGCTIDKAGIIATDDQGVAESGDGFNAESAKYVRGNAWTGNAYRYTWTKSKVGSGDIWYVRAYLVYTDAEGNVNTVYGDMVSQTME